MDSRPKRTVRLSCFDAWRSASSRTDGPRSMVSDATMAATSRAMVSVIARTPKRTAQCCAQAGQKLHRMTTSSSPASTGAPSRAWSSPTVPSRPASQLVFHLHRFDDHDRLARADGFARRHAPRARSCRASAPRAAAVPTRPDPVAAAAPCVRALSATAHETPPTRTLRQSRRGVRHDADVERWLRARRSGTACVPRCPGRAAIADAGHVDLPGPPVDRHDEPVRRRVQPRPGESGRSPRLRTALKTPVTILQSLVTGYRAISSRAAGFRASSAGSCRACSRGCAAP